MYNNKNDILQSYLDLEFAIFPVHTLDPDGQCTCGNANCGSVAKHPLTQRGVLDATKDESVVLTRYFAGDYAKANVGLATGEPSGVFVVDVDEPQALAALESQYEPLPKTWAVESSSGKRHVYFRFDGRCQSLKNAVRFAGGLDVRTTGGYALLPPSVHASGNEYRWLTSPADTPLADCPDWLFALLPKHEAETKTQTQTIERARSLAERCRLYLEKIPPAISGEGGHNHTLAVVCHCVEYFGSLSDNDLLQSLHEWNERCEPPWTEKELRHKLKAARDRIDAGDCNPSKVTLDEWPTLGEDAFHGIAGELVKAIEPHSESDPAALLVTLLTAFGVAVGRTPFFVVEGTKHYANVFSCIVGASARARKGTSLGWVTSVLDSADETFAACRLSGLSTGEGVVASLRDELITESNGTFTVPASDRRTWFVESEFGRTLKAMKRESSTLSAVLRDAWDSGTLSVLTRNDPLKASNAHVGVTAHVTQAELAKTLDSTEALNGFANRFLWCCAKRSKLLPNGSGDVSLDAFVERLRQTITKAKTIQRMRRTPACAERWEAVYSSLVAEKSAPVWDAVTSRAEAQALRLSMLYALLDGSDTIDVAHLDAALAVWRYCDDSARCLFAEATEGGTLEAKLLSTIRERPGIMRSELKQSVSHRIGTDTFDAALRWLVDRGDVVCVPVYDRRQADTFYPAICKLKTKAETPTPVTQSPITSTLETKAEAKTETQALTPSDFLGEAATLTELFEWKNANGAQFVRRSDGMVWVTDEYATLLTPSLTAAIEANQETLAAFVPAMIGYPLNDPFDGMDADASAFARMLSEL